MTRMTFSQLKLNLRIQRALQREGYVQPTPIQTATIPHLLAGRDLMGCAQTGTGKTAAFALPIIQHLDQQRWPLIRRSCHALILSPTRELAAQIAESFRSYSHYLLAQVVIGLLCAVQAFRLCKHGKKARVSTRAGGLAGQDKAWVAHKNNRPVIRAISAGRLYRTTGGAYESQSIHNQQTLEGKDPRGQTEGQGATPRAAKTGAGQPITVGLYFGP